MFAAYSIVSLYARNPGEVRPWEVLRPLIIALVATAVLIWLLRHILKDDVRADFIAMLIIFFFSSSHLVYRIIEGYIPGMHGTPLLWSVILIESISILAAGSNILWKRYSSLKIRKQIVYYLNIVSIIMLAVPMISIGAFWLQAWDDEKQPWRSYLPEETLLPKNTPPITPNIYYIVLDGYGRQDILNDYFQFDNSDFINFLENEGFYIASESHSNYTQTTLSLASSLNMDYLYFVSGIIESDSINRLPLFELIANNRVRLVLEEIGYNFVVVDSGYTFTEIKDGDVFISPFPIALTDLERWFFSTTAINAVFESGFGQVLRPILPIAGYDTHRRFVVSGLEALTNLDELPSPKFVFAHIVAPHPPFVISGDGSPITPDRPYLTGDGAGFVSSAEEYQEGYIDQLEYISMQVEIAIGKILTSDPNAIIILQGDHGPGSLLNRESLDDSCMRERTSILNAYHFPYGQNKILYSSASPVNTFRIILNTFFEADLTLLPDLTFFATQSHPYALTEISDRVNAPCLP